MSTIMGAVGAAKRAAAGLWASLSREQRRAVGILVYLLLMVTGLARYCPLPGAQLWISSLQLTITMGSPSQQAPSPPAATTIILDLYTLVLLLVLARVLLPSLALPHLSGLLGTVKRAAASLGANLRQNQRAYVQWCVLYLPVQLLLLAVSYVPLPGPLAHYRLSLEHPVMWLLQLVVCLTYAELLAVLLMEGRNPHTFSGRGISSWQAHSTTLLSFAVQFGYVVIAEAFLAHGAIANTWVAGGHSLLSLAVSRGHTDLVRLLLSKGADPNAFKDSYRSVLAQAVHQGSLDIVGLLLQAGAKGRLLPAGDFTDALLAACYGSTHSPAMARLLLQHDTPATKEGLASLLLWQLRNNHYETAAQLVRHLEQEHPGSAASVVRTTPHNAAARRLAMLKGWAGGSSSDAEQAAVVEQEREVVAQSAGARELLLGYEAEAAADRVAEGGDVA